MSSSSSGGPPGKPKPMSFLEAAKLGASKDKPASTPVASSTSIGKPATPVPKGLPAPPKPGTVPEPVSKPVTGGIVASAPGESCPSPSPIERGYPLGFKDKAQFEECMQELCQAANDSGIATSATGVRGTAATFFSENPNKPGHYFDGPGYPQSDIDVFFVTADKLIPWPNGDGFFHPNKIKDSYPKIAAWNRKWTRALGRKATAAAFKPDAPALDEDHISYSCK